MYCKNCGSPMDDTAAVCIKCGTPKGQGFSFCANCGTQVDPNAAICINCGAALNTGMNQIQQSGNSLNAFNSIMDGFNGVGKSKTTACILYATLGAFGAGDFYLGYTKAAVIKLLMSIISCGTLAAISAIWSSIDAISLMTGKYDTDAFGNKLNP